mmetsp:Transcript_60658/g.139106  ORF Transcript_60658/g.139106 Transcript_60658/m.139106 type:complete len:240 (+) Transcript_60658:757-1476(+)
MRCPVRAIVQVATIHQTRHRRIAVTPLRLMSVVHHPQALTLILLFAAHTRTGIKLVLTRDLCAVVRTIEVTSIQDLVHCGVAGHKHTPRSRGLKFGKLESCLLLKIEILCSAVFLVHVWRRPPPASAIKCERSLLLQKGNAARRAERASMLDLSRKLPLPPSGSGAAWVRVRVGLAANRRDVRLRFDSPIISLPTRGRQDRRRSLVVRAVVWVPLERHLLYERHAMCHTSLQAARRRRL